LNLHYKKYKQTITLMTQIQMSNYYILLTETKPENDETMSEDLAHFLQIQ